MGPSKLLVAAAAMLPMEATNLEWELLAADWSSSPSSSLLAAPLLPLHRRWDWTPKKLRLLSSLAGSVHRKLSSLSLSSTENSQPSLQQICCIVQSVLKLILSSWHFCFGFRHFTLRGWFIRSFISPSGMLGDFRRWVPRSVPSKGHQWHDSIKVRWPLNSDVFLMIYEP